jgi:hypothetical protein
VEQVTVARVSVAASLLSDLAAQTVSPEAA